MWGRSATPLRPLFLRGIKCSGFKREPLSMLGLFALTLKATTPTLKCQLDVNLSSLEIATISARLQTCKTSTET